MFRYVIITGRAEYNPAPDLATALAVSKQQHHPFLSAEELPDFLKSLESYTGSILTKNAAKIVMLTGVRTQEMRFAGWDEINFERAVWGSSRRTDENAPPPYCSVIDAGYGVVQTATANHWSLSLYFYWRQQPQKAYK